ncbi:amt-3 (predicted) [Pycnogonum litorale]
MVNGTVDYNSPLWPDDVTWILTSAFLIFTMQSGYALLESGVVSAKNEVNILAKNIANTVFGSISYWCFGYGLSFGSGPGTSLVLAIGDIGQFFVHADIEKMGVIYSTYIFQVAYATSATTLISGAMAERGKFSAYCIFSLLNVLVYCVPAGWLLGRHGFLRELGVADVGGSGHVHLVGSCAGLVGAMMLGPRIGRFDFGPDPPPLGNATNSLMGLFILWWGWLGFNAGSTFGITGQKWGLAARAAVTTVISSMAGGMIGMLYCVTKKRGMYDVSVLMHAVLASLVSISAGCPVVRVWQAIIIGAVGAVLVLLAVPLIYRLRIDDPVDSFAVHGVAGVWGMLAVGLFNKKEYQIILENIHTHDGLYEGGGFAQLGIQAAACGCFIVWSTVSSFIIFFIISKTVGLRSTKEEEIIGLDYVDHRITHKGNEKIIGVFEERRKERKKIKAKMLARNVVTPTSAGERRRHAWMQKH